MEYAEENPDCLRGNSKQTAGSYWGEDDDNGDDSDNDDDHDHDYDGGDDGEMIKEEKKEEDAPATTALQLLLKLVQAGPEACEAGEAVRMGAQLCRALTPHGIFSAGVAAGLAQVASALKSPTFDSALVSLVQQCTLEHMLHCVQLVSATSVSEPLQAALFQSLVVAAELTAHPPQLPASIDGPKAAALARTILTSASNVPAHVRDPYAQPFVQAVLAHPISQSLLQAVLQDKAVGEVAKDPRVSPLVMARIAELAASTGPSPPQFSWEQPEAVVPGYPQVRW
jgi:hypothetical protein